MVLRKLSDLNVTKTKELLVDFWKQPPEISPITTDGELVEKYKCLGIILDKVKFDSNVLNINKNVITECIAYKG